MTSQAVEAMWICVGSYGWLRGRWVKMIMNTRIRNQRINNIENQPRLNPVIRELKQRHF